MVCRMVGFKAIQVRLLKSKFAINRYIRNQIRTQKKRKREKFQNQ